LRLWVFDSLAREPEGEAAQQHQYVRTTRVRVLTQDTLRRLLVRLGREHPYHTLYHLLALKHGNYDKHGRPGSADRTEGGMLRTVDADKVAAAGSTLDAIRADPSRSATCRLNGG